MKKFFTLLFLVLSAKLFAQTYPITSITISLPANPDAIIASWGTGPSLLTIVATTKLENGRVDGRVQESKLLIIVKKGGSKICGAYTNNSAPASNFNTVTKVWSGNNAVSLLGQDCTLPPGDYELCAQFFGYNNGKTIPFSEEKCKSFTIRGNEQQVYQAPQAIAPVNEYEISGADIKKPITFRWTPVIPRPTDVVTYQLRVWQLMQGQNGAQAMKANPPIVTKDVNNLTQALVSNLITGPCKPPYLCDFVWNVQALNREGKPIGTNNGTSETFSFKFSQETEQVTPPTLVFPSKGETISGEPKFSWLPPMPTPPESILYKIKIVEIKGDQSPEEALRSNKPHFEKDSLRVLSFQYPSSAPPFGAQKYAWNIQALNRDGKPIGPDNGISKPETFTTDNTKMLGGANADFVLDSIYCVGVAPNGKFKYHIKATYKNLASSLDNILINDAQILPPGIWPGNPGGAGLNRFNNIRQKSGTYNGALNIIPGIVDASAGTIAGLLPVGGPFVSSIAPGSQQTVEFDYIGSGTGAVTFTFYGLVEDSKKAQANRNARNEDLQVNKWPQCPCTYCTEDMIKFNGPTQFTDNTTFLTVSQNVSVSVPVKQFKAEIIAFSIRPQNNNDQCLVCNKKDANWGNFTSGTLASTFPGMVNGAFPSLPCCGGNSHHTIGWWINTPPPYSVNITNKNLKLNISLPPRSTLSCCPYIVNFCVRYTFTDAECRSCSIIKCYSYTLQPPSGGGPANTLDLALPTEEVQLK
ncbi:MAG: hypothetical protein JWQ25_641 [Daejeonella sp.]|nr:hypothetical protein [Daejeonella sp.]